ncbi:Innexin inx2 [Pseudolycoriella hygida]|uniref:Innexin n=1 Tax=Pseudolycoriella hygida TaxID=35572 RepID=A0A9Q0S013_9DIPT|nr:Innexin inx2 [Pseudolycoriella hygida]
MKPELKQIRKMPLTIASVLNFIPANIWRPLKKFVTQDKTVVFDLCFKMSTKYTPALLTALMCLSFANQFVRNIELDCSTNGVLKGTHGHGFDSSDTDKGLNDFCWNHETFLVVKALDPRMRGIVTYPGVSGYDKDADELLRQRYYKYVWIIFGKLAVIAFAPYFFWKGRGVRKIKPLVAITDSLDYSEEDQRLTYYLETVGMNESFSWFYVFCKTLATFTPVAQWYLLCGFIGKRFRLYGYDVLNFFMEDSDPWPNPMDILFPKMAKCEWSRYGYSGDLEIKSAQCQMPMNNITQWSFFIYWCWLVVIFAANVLSLIYLIVHIFPCCRRYRYRKYIAAACREDVEKLRNHIVPNDKGKRIKRKHDKSKVISINMKFGDWLVLSLMKKNLEEWKFRDFIRQLATTENSVIQLIPIQVVVPPLPTLTAINEVSHRENPDDVDGHRPANMEIGFKPLANGDISFKHALINPQFDINETYAPAIPTTPAKPATPARSSGEPTSSNGEQNPVKISAPIKVDRKNVQKANPKKTPKEKGKSPAPSHAQFGWKGGVPPNQGGHPPESWER